MFSFQISQEHSSATLGVANQKIRIPYHGMVFVDREKQIVARIVTIADAPPDFPLQNATHILDYGLIPVAKEEFVLPLHAELDASVPEELVRQDSPRRPRSREVLLRNEVDFLDYQKYTAESTLKFDTGK